MIKLLQTLFIVILSFSLHGQSITISGVVSSSADKQPIIGGAVTLLGDGEELVGTVTEFDGTYTITVPSKESVLEFTYIGLKTQIIIVGEQTTIDVLLEPDASLLYEVVVIGYGTEKRSNINGAVSVITAEDISETPSLRVEQALQGRSSGVVVAQNSGSPGSAMTVRIRGNGSLSNSDPLYIVDGVPVSGLDFLNTADIQSISILKDAASLAIYGSRGANGVVLITTKSGDFEKEGMISYDGYYGVQKSWKKLNLLNAREYAIIQNEAFIAAGRTPRPEFQNPDALGEGTDWQDEVFQTAPMQSHSINMSGGGKKASYALTGGYFQQDGIVGGKKSSFKRYNVRLNSKFKIKEWLTVGNTIGFTNLGRRALAENNEFSTPLIRALNIDPLTSVKKDDGTYAYSKYADTDIANPVNQIAQTFDLWTSNRVVGSVYSLIDFTKDLSLRTSYSVDATFATQDIFLPRYNLSVDPDLRDAPAQEIRDQNSIILNNNTWKNSQIENLLTYKKVFAQKHDLKVNLGNTVLQTTYARSGASNSNLVSNDPEDAYIDNATGDISAQTGSGFEEETALLSYFARVNYAYDERYVATVVMRADGSSKFGPENKFGYFPSFSLGWVISKEKWDLYPVTYMKARAGWGRNGNDNIGVGRYLSVVQGGQNYAFGPNETITNGTVALIAANSEIKWETSEQLDVGVDVELWNGKVNITTDYFIKNTKDMLFAPPIPATVGTAAPTRNIATMINKGWELSAVYRDEINGFSYDIGANITVIRNEVTALGLGAEPIGTGNVTFHGGNVVRTDIGQPLGSFYGYVTDGIFQNGEEVAAHAFQNTGTAPGDIRYKDLNGDNVIDQNDRAYIGNPNPDFSYGMTLGAKYKGVDLGMFIQGVGGNDIYNATVRYDLVFSNKPNSILDRWTGEGTSNSEPRVSLSDPNNNTRVSDRFVEDGSYLRFKNIQIGYTLPEKIMEKIKVQKLRVYASGNNVFTFTKYSGFDPEIGAYGGALEAGIDRGFYPQARSIIFGLQLTF
ncbi:MAG: TonB-linked SusC/RagA family outer membrane protein [Maribacter sp.]|jgi:TonB-linked SusC/RagA family outer membrane protein